MNQRVPKKALTPLALASTLVVLVAVLGYLSLTGRPSRPQPKAASPASAPLRTSPVVPPASTPSLPGGAGPTVRSSGAQPSPATPPPAASPAAGAPGGAGPASGAAAAKAQPPQSAAKSASGTGQAKPGAAAPASTTPAAAQPNPEVAVVGTGQRGRSDPFSPLASPEHPVSRGPSLPPPPAVGLPMPPGFATPGGMGATPPPQPGAGMRVAGIMGSRSRVAIIESDGGTYIVGVGDRVGDAVVVSIMPNKVILKQRNVTFELGFGGDRSS